VGLAVDIVLMIKVNRFISLNTKANLSLSLKTE